MTMKVPTDDDSLESVDTDEERLIYAETVETKEAVNPILSCVFGSIAYIQYFWYYQRAEFVLGLILLVSIALALTGTIEALEGHGRAAPKSHFVMHDFSDVMSSYELKAGNIDHWCFGGGDDSCPKCLDPLEPVPNMDRSWGKAHNNNVKSINSFMLNEGDIDVVFLGDGLVEARSGLMMGKPSPMMDKIKKNFRKQFSKKNDAKYNGIALGVENDKTANLLWRIKRGEAPEWLQPKVWWITIGINDLIKASCSEDVTLMGILRIVEELEEINKGLRDPATIVVNSLLPYSTAHDKVLEGSHVKNKFYPSIKQVNENLAKFASKHKRVKFFDANDIFVQTRNKKKYMKKDLFLDGIHPNEEGQRLWGESQYTMIDQIIQSVAKAKQASYGYDEDDLIPFLDDYYLYDNSTYYDDIFG